MANKTGKGGFKKGVSGNRRGRPKGSKDARTIITKYYEEHKDKTKPLQYIIELFNNSKESSKIRFMAAKEIADRLYGKPESNSNVEVEGLNISIKRKDDDQEKY